MKNSIFSTLLLASSLLLSFSCEKSTDDCGDIPFTPIAFSNFSSILVENSEMEDKFLVIQNQQDFEAKIKFTSKSNDENNGLTIDFNKYTLLIGKKKISQIEGSLNNQTLI